MRKLILVAVIAMMSTSSCYANLSLASNDTPQAATEQPKPQKAETRPGAAVKLHSASKPRRQHPSRQLYVIRSWYDHCM